MRLLFLSGARRYFSHKLSPLRDPSFVYRLHNSAISAKILGHQVGIYHNLDLLNPIVPRNWDIAIMHRPSFNTQFEMTLDKLQKYKIPIFGDFDDLIFSYPHANHRPSVINGFESIEESRMRVKKHLQAIDCIDGVTVSNTFLKNIFVNSVKEHKQCIQLSNSWHYSWKDKIDYEKKQQSLKQNLSSREKTIYLTYFSGTKTHDSDLAMIEDQLINLTDKEKNLKFLVIGKVSLSKKLKEKSLQIKKVPFSKYHQLVSQSHLNIAPLESTFFNNAKSSIKIIEAGFFGIQTVCSPIPEYISTPETSRLIAYTWNDWVKQLKQGIQNRNNSSLLKRLKRDIKEKYHPLETTKKFISKLESRL
tara:strand:- start:21126 stop:22208 length:1083 start_codon:yes stop_codon:yes gene_type:complete